MSFYGGQEIPGPYAVFEPGTGLKAKQNLKHISGLFPSALTYKIEQENNIVWTLVNENALPASNSTCNTRILFNWFSINFSILV